MTDPAQISLSFPAIRCKKVTAAFDGGAITSDAGVLLLAQAERRLGIGDRLAALIPHGRDPARVTHSLVDILRARVLAIACGYEDHDDLDALRHDPAFMMALGKAPGEPIGLASQPTMSRWENVPDLRTLIRIGREMVDVYCASHAEPPSSVSRHVPMSDAMRAQVSAPSSDPAKSAFFLVSGIGRMAFSTPLVTGMKMSVLMFGRVHAGLVYAASIRDGGTGSTIVRAGRSGR